MSWLKKLYETYDKCYGVGTNGKDQLAPISHTYQIAHIEIVIDQNGNFRRAIVLDKEHCNTLIPCTEQSVNRSGRAPRHHPLCDKLQYVAADFSDFGGIVTSGFKSDPEKPHRDFLTDLSAWASSEFNHPKLNSILAYIKKGCLISDLVKNKILHVDIYDNLLKIWDGVNSDTPTIFKALAKSQTQSDALIRWSVEDPSIIESSTSHDKDLISSWILYYESMQQLHGYCLISGNIVPLATLHPAKLRHGGDKAKLISSNDINGFTFKGRFIDSDQALSIGYVVTQKAHNALRWLIKKQGYRNGGQAIVCWSTSGAIIPDPFYDTLRLFEDIELEQSAITTCSETSQGFAIRLNKAIAGYKTRLNPTDDIAVMCLDSATPGRMSVTFYRELTGSEFLRRILDWHLTCSWTQNFGNNKKFIGAPAPRDIAEAAYGRRLDDKLCSTTIEKLLPCIIDGQDIPFNLIQSIFYRVCNRVGIEKWEWEKCLGIACALFKSQNKNRGYKMSLENRITRDYLYGRLLAIADSIESIALGVSGEKRDTTASRLMKRFSERPYSTWRNIELALGPYKARLRSNRQGAYHRREKLMDQIMISFKEEDFMDDKALSAEFLLGFHCQRNDLRSTVNKNEETELLETEDSN